MTENDHSGKRIGYPAQHELETLDQACPAHSCSENRGMEVMSCRLLWSWRVIR